MRFAKKNAKFSKNKLLEKFAIALLEVFLVELLGEIEQLPKQFSVEFIHKI